MRNKKVVKKAPMVLLIFLFFIFPLFFSRPFSEVCYHDRFHYILIFGQKKGCPKILSEICNILLPFTKACLKKAFRKLRVPVCGRFCPSEGGLSGLRQPNEAKI